MAAAAEDIKMDLRAALRRAAADEATEARRLCTTCANDPPVTAVPGAPPGAPPGGGGVTNKEACEGVGVV